jgi:hypothetical protein
LYIVLVLNDQNQNAQVPDVGLRRTVHHGKLPIHQRFKRCPKVFDN